MKQPIKKMFQIFVWAVFFTVSVQSATLAQEEGADYQARLELADKMLQINPPRDQVKSAFDRYIERNMASLEEVDKVRFRAAMMKIFNIRSLEITTREAYAEIFTREELEAMVEYYSKPEAISAREKMPELQERLAPLIARMMDQALMRARTGQ